MDITFFYLAIASYLFRKPKPSLGGPIALLIGIQDHLLDKGRYRIHWLPKMGLAIPTLSSSDGFVPALLRTYFSNISFLSDNSPRVYLGSLD